jgi:hypothetical protein
MARICRAISVRLVASGPVCGNWRPIGRKLPMGRRQFDWNVVVFKVGSGSGGGRRMAFVGRANCLGPSSLATGRRADDGVTWSWMGTRTCWPLSTNGIDIRVEPSATDGGLPINSSAEHSRSVGRSPSAATDAVISIGSHQHVYKRRLLLHYVDGRV